MDRNQSGNRKTYSKLNNAGFTLVELLIVIAILGVIGGIIVGFLQSGSRSYQSTEREVDIQYDAQVLLNQIGDYVMKANSGIKKQDDSIYIYNNREGVLEKETISYEPEDKTLSYKKSEMVNDTETTVVDKTILAKNVEKFTVDVSKADTGRKVDAELAIEQEERSYEATATWNLRNSVAVDTVTEEDDSNTPDPVVNEVKVFGDETELWPGEEQLFYARVIGTNNPSQSVVWFIEGDTTSEDTYIEDGGILHVGEDETATTLKVAAQSVQNPAVTGRLDVQIHSERIRITPEEVWVSPAGGMIDPDSYGIGTVDLQAEVLGMESTELTTVSWACSKTSYQTSMAEQSDDLNKQIVIDTTEKTSKITVQMTGTDADGNVITSNQAVIHVVRIESNNIRRGKEACLRPTNGPEEEDPDNPKWDPRQTRLYIYGLEDISKEDLMVADSFEDIRDNKKNTKFYIYDSRELLYYTYLEGNVETIDSGLYKNGDGSWSCNVSFFPSYTVWDRLFPNTESRYTGIGIYKAGELNRKTDVAGESCYFGFSVLKVSLKEFIEN